MRWQINPLMEFVCVLLKPLLAAPDEHKIKDVLYWISDLTSMFGLLDGTWYKYLVLGCEYLCLKYLS